MSTFTDTEIDAITRNFTAQQKVTFNTQFNAVKKNRGTAIVLSVVPIVGHIGGGRFYLGQTGLGILHLGLCFTLIGGMIYWIVDWFLIGTACDNWNREKAREIAAQVKAIG
jgi:TM2 domain-containing membrane protein YozV